MVRQRTESRAMDRSVDDDGPNRQRLIDPLASHLGTGRLYKNKSLNVSALISMNVVTTLDLTKTKKAFQRGSEKIIIMENSYEAGALTLRVHDTHTYTCR